jgi:hydroxyethylthiazole kinase
MFEGIIESVRESMPIVHAITNYVTVNDCANIILAAGGSPTMADNKYEVEDVTSIANVLVINIGTLNEDLVEAMIKAGKKANELGHPVILDPVGIGSSEFRTNFVFDLLKEVDFSVIRGNISEIKTIYKGDGTTKGVDADENDAVTDENIDEVIAYIKDLSEKTCAVIAVTGGIDIVADSKKAYIIRNGHPLMPRVTGTGCMLTTVIGSFCGANRHNILEATAAAVSAMGLCGELGYERMKEVDGGTSTYRTYIIDFMSKMNSDLLNGGAKVEIR